jgi:hypothetical protein
MNRQLFRIQRGYFFAYYRRLFGVALQETRQRLTVLTITSVAFVVLNVLFTWVFTNRGVGVGFAIGFASVATLWFVVGLWFLVTIPPRIENDMQRKEQVLQARSQRDQVANEIRNHLGACRMAAVKARAVAIEEKHRGMIPDTFHQQALVAAEDAGERLERLGKQAGQVPYDQYVLEITGAVSTKKCSSFEDAIAQLEALAEVFERQLSSGVYY